MLVGTLGIAHRVLQPRARSSRASSAGSALFLAFLGMRVIPVNVGAVLLLLAGVGAPRRRGVRDDARPRRDRGRRLPRARARSSSWIASSPDYRFEPGCARHLAVDRVADADHRRARARVHGLEDRGLAQAAAAARRAGPRRQPGRGALRRSARPPARRSFTVSTGRRAAQSPIPRGRGCGWWRWTGSSSRWWPTAGAGRASTSAARPPRATAPRSRLPLIGYRHPRRRRPPLVPLRHPDHQRVRAGRGAPARPLRRDPHRGAQVDHPVHRPDDHHRHAHHRGAGAAAGRHHPRQRLA